MMEKFEYSPSSFVSPRASSPTHPRVLSRALCPLRPQDDPALKGTKADPEFVTCLSDVSDDMGVLRLLGLELVQIVCCSNTTQQMLPEREAFQEMHVVALLLFFIFFKMEKENFWMRGFSGRDDRWLTPNRA